MKKYCLSNSLIGNYYPFYLTNEGNNDSYYLYQIVSPGLSSKCVPTISLKKVGEHTKKGDYSANEKDMRDTDILAYLFGTRENLQENAGKYLTGNILAKDNPKVITHLDHPTKFPEVEIGMDNNIQKALIVNLRDELRWKYYRFVPGYVVDILFSPTRFITFRIKGDQNCIWIEPEYINNNTDPERSKPTYPEWDKKFLDDVTSHKFSGKEKASALNRYIKQLEWAAFK